MFPLAPQRIETLRQDVMVTTQCRVVVCSMDLTVYMAVIEDLEQMSSRIGCEVCAGAPRNVAGQMIVKPDEEECPDCLGSYLEDVLCG